MRNTFFATGILLGITLLLPACGDDVATQTGGTSSSSSSSSSGSIGAGGAGGGGTGGSMGQGGSDIVPGDPITAPAETWTFIPFDDAVCGNGSPTGLGINLTDKSQNVIIYMMGGGACWDAFTCYTLKSAANMDGYDAAKFQNDVNAYLGSSLFDRNDPQNPTKDYSYVFIPYCTGDVHGGDNIANYNGTETHHKGLANVKAFLNRLVSTFPKAERILLSGSSAGGFGAGLNWWRVMQAFPGVRIDMIDDSAQPLPSPYLSLDRQNTWRTAWNLNGALPPDCPECQSELSALLPYYNGKTGNARGALLSYTQDNVISAFYGPINTAYFEEGLQKFTQEKLEGLSQFKYFYMTGQNHVLLGDPGLTSKGVVLKDWLVQMINDDPNWASVNPWMP